MNFTNDYFMTSQLLFYNQVSPVTAELHSSWHVREVKDFSFAKNTNSVPVMGAEFVSALSNFPIVFAGDEESVIPVLLLGMRNSENVFIGPGGSWEGRYIPAFVRRYPFILSLSDDQEKYYLCIDETFPGFNQSGEGPALFGSDGLPTEYIENVLQFLSHYQAEFESTKVFCKKLKDLNLLESKQVKTTLSNGETIELNGFFAVEPSRLATLPSEAIVDLARSGSYSLICFHLASLRNFELLRDRTVNADLIEVAP